MKRFTVGQKVKYVGTKVEYSPLYGEVGTVKRIGTIGVDYQVSFPSDVNGVALYYHYDELEPLGYGDSMTIFDGRNELLYAC